MKIVKVKKVRKRSKGRFLLILIFLLGAGVFAYPSVSQWYEGRKSVLEVLDYDKNISRMSAEEYERMWQEALAYNEELSGNAINDPFADYDISKLPVGYREKLNIDGMMGYIELPKIGEKLPIYHGTSEEVLQKGIGHMEGTALPVGGKGTHVVLTGHTGLPNARIFTDLIKMEVGDQFNVRVLNKELVYQIDQIKVVEPDDISDLMTDPEGDYATLITCTPYGINSHRLLVRGKHIFTLTKQLRLNSYYFRWVFVGGGNRRIFTIVFYGLLGMNGILLLILRRDRRRRKRNARISGSPYQKG